LLAAPGRFEFFRKFAAIFRELMFIAGVNDTGEKLLTGVNDTANKFSQKLETIPIGKLCT
jgi:hypothetical protein